MRALPNFAAAALLPVLVGVGCAHAKPRSSVSVSPLESCWLIDQAEVVRLKARCATYRVPERYDHDTGRWLSGRVAFIDGTAKRRGDTPIFVFVGGPGEAATFLFSSLVERLRRMGDRTIILMDQRGTGTDTSLRCPPEPRGTFERNQLEGETAYWQWCANSLTVPPESFSTAAFVEDVEHVLDGLGVDRVHVLGISYGTSPAMALALRNPDRVATLALDGAFDAGQPWELREARASDALGELLDACGRDPECHPSDVPSLRTMLVELLAELRGRPPEISLEWKEDMHRVQIHPRSLAGVIYNRLSSERRDTIPQFIRELYESRDWTWLARHIVQKAESRRQDYSRLELYLSVACAENPPSTGADHEPPEPSLLPMQSEEWFRSVCGVWPVRPRLGPSVGYGPSPVPTLFLSGGLDLLTPHSEVARFFPRFTNHRSLLVPTAGHGTTSFPCVRRALSHLWGGGDLSELNLDCSDWPAPQP